MGRGGGGSQSKVTRATDNTRFRSAYKSAKPERKLPNFRRKLGAGALGALLVRAFTLIGHILIMHMAMGRGVMHDMGAWQGTNEAATGPTGTQLWWSPPELGGMGQRIFSFLPILVASIGLLSLHVKVLD